MDQPMQNPKQPKNHRRRNRVLAILGTLMAVVGLMAASANFTGAYFTKTKSGIITGTVGSVDIATAGGSGTDGLNFAFTNLMPGEPQSATVYYTNTGTGNQDVYLTFPNVPALHALNNMGHYGEVTITDSSSGQVFHTTNLNDNRPDASGTCGPFSPAGCWPVPDKLLIRSNVPAGASGSVVFTFMLGSQTTGGQGSTWNVYPSHGAVGDDAASSGSGLPFNVVATQVGHTP